ncbi:MAG: pyrroloquinoline quinone biosynthesis protein [Pseudomonadota bacterium]|jgi:pyrroloquinoline quinone biosynthesis protein D
MMALNRASVPVLNPMFRLQWEPSQSGYVLLYPEGMVQLNGPAGEILSLIDGAESVQAMIDTLANKFPEAEGLAEDVVAFLLEAQQNQWLTFQV